MYQHVHFKCIQCYMSNILIHIRKAVIKYTYIKLKKKKHWKAGQ